MRRFPPRKMNILLVDEPIRRERVAKIILDESIRVRNLDYDDNSDSCVYKLCEASSNTMGLELFRSHHPDLVLIAGMGKEIDGINLVKSIRTVEAKRRTGVIILGRENHNNSKLCHIESLEAGADDYVSNDASDREMIARCNAVLRLKAVTDDLRKANHKLEVLSYTDDLTGLANMRFFQEYYEEALKKVENGVSGLGIIMMDLDEFKSINDTSNHLMGSFVLAEIGKLMKYSRIFPTESCLARYGGDEYVAAAMVSGADEIAGIAEKLRWLIENATFKKDTIVKKVTASLGVCFVSPYYQGKGDEPLKNADLMLYESKKLGRNKISVNSIVQCNGDWSYPINLVKNTEKEIAVPVLNALRIKK